MTLISNDMARLTKALGSAEAAFWADIEKSYPEATSGDLSPIEANNVVWAMRVALVEWLEFNCDIPREPQRTTEVMLHRIEYFYRDHDNILITDGDKEHIAYSISQGISEGELCALKDDNETEVYGWWKINNNPE